MYLNEIQDAIEAPDTTWESATPSEPMAHFTGRAAFTEKHGEWTIQLVCLGDQRMGAATCGLIIVKLTDRLAELAEEHARAYFARNAAEAKKELDRALAEHAAVSGPKGRR